MRNHLEQHIAAGRLSSIPDLLDGAGIREYRYAARKLHGVLRSQDGELLKLVESTSRSSDRSSQLLVCELVPFLYPHETERSLQILRSLIESDDWSIRDAASEGGGRIFRGHFSAMLDTMRHWRDSGDPNVRRAVVVASARASSPTHLERAEPLLHLLEPLLDDAESLVRRSLGPSTLGSVLLDHYPTIAFEYLIKWSTSNSAPALWNVAMAFSCKPAERLAKKALIVLRKLSLDERRFVWRAVASAMWKLGRRQPELIRPELARWLEDERRTDVAREALRHL